jgi:2-(1,2-epoxy-1,2-dihydrophenyl)acetyl-CoA isomerase
MTLGGELHTAEEFAAWGVIDCVLAADELHRASEEFASRLAAGPTRAFAVAKDLTSNSGPRRPTVTTLRPRSLTEAERRVAYLIADGRKCATRVR